MDAKPMYKYKANLASVGIHGYTYINEEPKKGTGNPSVIPTNKGYLKKEDLGDTPKVTVGNYIDLVLGIPPKRGEENYASSNQAELRALIELLKWILEKASHLTDIIIMSDSRYTVQGTNDWLDKWKKNGWRNTTGAEVKYKEMWLEVSDLMQMVKRQCVDRFELSWLRGHDGHVGNETADALATKGRALATNGITELQEKISDITGYWKVDNESPRILQCPRWYCSTTDMDYVDKEGRFIYYVGCHGSKDKEDELAGKSFTDNYLGVVKITDPDPVMEDLRNRYLKASSKSLTEILITHLDVVFSPKQYRELKELGWNYTIDMEGRIEKLNSEGSLIVTEMTPIGKGFRMVEVWKNQRRTLEEYHDGDQNYREVDMIDTFFDYDEKKNIYKIKPSMTQLVKKVDVKAPFNLAKRNETPIEKTFKITLVVGADILSRNQLAALASEIAEIKLITWRESDEVGRYATYIKLKNGDHGLWSRYDANMQLVK